MGQGGFRRGAKSDPACQPPVLSHSQALLSGWRRGTCLGSCGPCREVPPCVMSSGPESSQGLLWLGL